MEQEKETGWYYPTSLAESPYSPIFKVRDTLNKYGPYAQEVKNITLKDLIKYHGHFCGGLVEASVSLRVALGKLYPDGVIDRTDTRVVSNNSPCGGDVASYLTGGRLRFGTHFIDKTLKEGEFIVQQISKEKTFRVRINPEIYPHDVRKKMIKIESGTYTKEDLKEFQKLQCEYGLRLVSRSPFELFFAEEIEKFNFPEHPLPELGERHDNDHKNEGD